MTAPALREIRCRCGRLLGKALASGTVEIKCQRCREVVRVELAVQENR